MRKLKVLFCLEIWKYDWKSHRNVNELEIASLRIYHLRTYLIIRRKTPENNNLILFQLLGKKCDFTKNLENIV